MRCADSRSRASAADLLRSCSNSAARGVRRLPKPIRFLGGLARLRNLCLEAAASRGQFASQCGDTVAFLQPRLPQILHADAYRHDKAGSDRESRKTISRTGGAPWFDRRGVYLGCRNGLGRSRIRTRCYDVAGKLLLWCSPLPGRGAYRDIEAMLKIVLPLYWIPIRRRDLDRLAVFPDPSPASDAQRAISFFPLVSSSRIRNPPSLGAVSISWAHFCCQYLARSSASWPR